MIREMFTAIIRYVDDLDRQRIIKRMEQEESKALSEAAISYPRKHRSLLDKSRV